MKIVWTYLVIVAIACTLIGIMGALFELIRFIVRRKPSGPPPPDPGMPKPPPGDPYRAG